MHVVDITGGFEGRDPVEDYHVINDELARYAAELAERPQIVVANKCDAEGIDERLRALRDEALEDGHQFFAVSALTGEGMQALMLACGEQVMKLRAALDTHEEVEEFDRAWELKRRARERRFTVRKLAAGVFRIEGRAVERMVIQTDWENEEAIIHLQHRFQRMGVFDALAEAGCRAGDEVRVLERAFDYESADDLYADDPVDDEDVDLSFVTEINVGDDDAETDDPAPQDAGWAGEQR